MLAEPQLSQATDERWPQIAAGSDASTLVSIYEDNINIAIWQREQQQVLDEYAAQWVEQKPSHTPRVILSANQPKETLEQLLPNIENKDLFLRDINYLVEMFACLFEVNEVGLRLTPLNKAMCPKFHVDNIPCRLVTTYGGLGTEWLTEENLNRQFLGKGSHGLPDEQSGIFNNANSIQQVKSQHVSLLKGSGWEGNEKTGLVHRSPSLSNGQTRLLLTMDFS